MAEDIYVFEDQGWYGLVALDGGYLLVYFLLGYDVTLGSCEGYSVGCLSVPDVFFLTTKLYKAPVPDGCWFCSIPASNTQVICKNAYYM
jgi:hypothetical protein